MTFNIERLYRELDMVRGRVGKREEPPVIPDSLIEFTKQYRFLGKTPFSFDYVDKKTGEVIPEARKYLYDLYSNPSDRIVVVKGRQMEITEFAVNYILFHALKHKGCTIIYTSPRQDQVSRFSRRRLRKWGIYDNPDLRKLLSEEPSVHELNIRDSVCYMFSAWHDGDALRNISGDVAVIDECQDANLLETFPVIEQALSHSAINKMLLIGTPKNAGEEFEKIWRLSSQKTWDKEKSVWVPKQPSDPWEGYHISQLMAPWLTPRYFERLRKQYVPQKYENEVLGLFFKGAGKPLTVEDMERITDSTLGFTYGATPERLIYSGNDWGTGSKANTVMVVIEVFEKGSEPPSYKVLWVENISLSAQDSMGEVKQIGRIIEDFSVRKHVGDIGFGHVQISELRKTYGDRVTGCFYAGNVKEPIKRKMTALGPIVEVDRSAYIDKTIDVIKRGRDRIIIPGADYDKKEWIWSELISLYLEAEETAQGRRYRRWQHEEGVRDDVFHSLTYALIAYELDSPYRGESGASTVSFGEGPQVDFG